MIYILHRIFNALYIKIAQTLRFSLIFYKILAFLDNVCLFFILYMLYKLDSELCEEEV